MSDAIKTIETIHLEIFAFDSHKNIYCVDLSFQIYEFMEGNFNRFCGFFIMNTNLTELEEGDGRVDNLNW